MPILPQLCTKKERGKKAKTYQAFFGHLQEENTLILTVSV